MTAQVDEEGGAEFVPVDPDGTGRGPTLRETVAKARADHRERMAFLADTVVAIVRPRWVVTLPWTAATQRKADHWQLAANAAFTVGVLLNMSLVARGLLVTTVFAPVIPVVGLAATFTVLKLVRLQLHRPFGEEKSRYHDDEGGSYSL